MPASQGPATRLDHYRLEHRLALGGMAEIFLAVDERNGRTVALKRLLPQISSDHDFLERFFHEIQIQIALKHRNIVELIDCNPDPARPYIVMEFVDGGSLHGLRSEVKKLPWELALFAAAEALNGLAVAHRKQIVHRDVKPHNLMWTKAGVVKLADFGISHAANMTRLTVTGTVVGTPANMSPEQARGDVLDGRSDLFSIGTTIYELTAGFNPFTADSVAATLRRVTEVEPEPLSLLDPGIPAGLDALLVTLLAKNRDGRIGSAEEAAQRARDLLAREGVGQPHDQFREFVAAPKEFVEARRLRHLADARRRTEVLLADSKASPEKVLWAAYETMSCAPDDPEARSLFQTASERAGQRPTPVENARIRELEAQLRKEPDNVGILLQLAKLYRLERDFVSVMRFFRKLQAVAPPDPYTQGQIAALVGGSAPAGAPAQGPRHASILSPPPPEPARPSRALLALGGLGVAGALAGAIWWARRPGLDLNAASEAERAHAERVVGLIRSAQRTPAPPSAPGGRESTLQGALEKGALVEKESGAARALAFYRERLPRLAAASERATLLLTMSETAERAQDLPQAAALCDEAAAENPAVRSGALLRKAALLAKGGDGSGAVAIWDELSRGEDPDAARAASLQLAIAADRTGDAARALTLYEQLLARAPESPEANPARLGAAAIHRTQGHAATARQLYEEVRRTAPPTSDFARSAETGLKSLE